MPEKYTDKIIDSMRTVELNIQMHKTWEIEKILFENINVDKEGNYVLKEKESYFDNEEGEFDINDYNEMIADDDEE